MLQGSLENFSLDEVLGLLSGTSKSGQLEIAGDRGTGSLTFRNGGLVDGTVSSPVDEEPGLEDIMFELLRFSSGTFSFVNGEVDPPADGTDVEDVDQVLTGADRRLADWREIEAVVPSLAHHVAPVSELPADEVTITRADWATLVVIAAGCPASTVCDHLALGEVEGSRRIKELAERQLINVGEPLSPNDVPADSTVDSLVPSHAPATAEPHSDPPRPRTSGAATYPPPDEDVAESASRYNDDAADGDKFVTRDAPDPADSSSDTVVENGVAPALQGSAANPEPTEEVQIAESSARPFERRAPDESLVGPDPAVPFASDESLVGRDPAVPPVPDESLVGLDPAVPPVPNEPVESDLGEPSDGDEPFDWRDPSTPVPGDRSRIVDSDEPSSGIEPAEAEPFDGRDPGAPFASVESLIGRDAVGPFASAESLIGRDPEVPFASAESLIGLDPAVPLAGDGFGSPDLGEPPSRHDGIGRDRVDPPAEIDDDMAAFEQSDVFERAVTTADFEPTDTGTPWSDAGEPHSGSSTDPFSSESFAGEGHTEYAPPALGSLLPARDGSRPMPPPPPAGAQPYDHEIPGDRPPMPPMPEEADDADSGSVDGRSGGLLSRYLRSDD